MLKCLWRWTSFQPPTSLPPPPPALPYSVQPPPKPPSLEPASCAYPYIHQKRRILTKQRVCQVVCPSEVSLPAPPARKIVFSPGNPCCKDFGKPGHKARKCKAGASDSDLYTFLFGQATQMQTAAHSVAAGATQRAPSVGPKQLGNPPMSQSQPVKQPQAAKQPQPVKQPQAGKQPQPVKQPQAGHRPQTDKQPQAATSIQAAGGAAKQSGGKKAPSPQSSAEGRPPPMSFVSSRPSSQGQQTQTSQKVDSKSGEQFFRVGPPALQRSACDCANCRASLGQYSKNNNQLEVTNTSPRIAGNVQAAKPNNKHASEPRCTYCGARSSHPPSRCWQRYRDEGNYLFQRSRGYGATAVTVK